ncbi:Retrovirus-related Pol polyprotein from transposon 17.6, partial [Mucuna pruriens]
MPPEDIPLGLPPLSGIEHHIDLSLGETLPNKVVYQTNPEEGKEIQKQVGKLLEKEWVRESITPCVMPMILMPKKDVTWRMCIDYRHINNIIVRCRHPILHLDDLINCMISVRKGNEWKIAFKTKFRLYEWLVMHFGLTIVLSTFMRLMNHVLRNLIGKSVVIYLDDILIFSTCLNDHLLHVRISSHGVKVDREKLKAIQEWSTSKTIGEVRRFHGLASFYIRFVKDFSTLATPLNEILEGDQEKAFQVLKERLTQALIFALPNFSKSFKLECHVSSIGVKVVLLQAGH